MPSSRLIDTSASTSTSTPPNGPKWPYLVMVALGLFMVALVWVLVTATGIPVPPPKYELQTTSVPLAKQTLVLLDVATADSGFYTLMEGEFVRLASSQQPDERLCVLPIGPDKPLLKVTPWCSVQRRQTWWVLPEAPSADAPESVAHAYSEAIPGLAEELVVHEGRSQASWDAVRSELMGTLTRFMWQLPMPQYQDIKGSLGVLLQATRTGEYSQTPTEVVIYSWMRDTPYEDWTQHAEAIPTAPSQLVGTTVRVNLFSLTGGQELDSLKLSWEPWFQTAHPVSVDWRVLALTPPSIQVHKSGPTGESMTSHHQLPPVVRKQVFPDATSVVNGMDAPGDVTNVIR